MANEKDPEPGTRGYRVEQVRKAIGLQKREDLAPALANIATTLGLADGGAWSATRVSRIILGRQPMSLDDAAAVVKLAESFNLKGKDWDWLVFGDRRIATIDPSTVVPEPRPVSVKRTAKRVSGTTK